MTLGFAIEFFHKQGVGAAVAVDIVREVGRAAGLNFPVLGIRQQDGIGFRRQRDTIAFRVVGHAAVFGLLPGHFLAACHVAELIYQPFGGWMQHQDPPFRLSRTLSLTVTSCHANDQTPCHAKNREMMLNPAS